MSKFGRILIVDDEKDNLSALTRILRKDFDVQSIEGSLEALKFLDQDSAFDVILSDQRMPGMTGSELFERIQDINPYATRILISGFSDLEAVIDAVNRGHIWKYISKPWEPDELKQTLKDGAERSQMKLQIEKSQMELKRASLELRAKDWSRTRLLKLLLHEFRSIPQVLQNVLALNEDSEHAKDRETFLSGLNSRVERLQGDVESLMQDEKELSQQSREPLNLFDVVEALAGDLTLKCEVPKNALVLQSSKELLVDGLSHLLGLLTNNSANAPVELKLESALKNKKIFLTLSCESESSILPSGLKDSKIEADLAWRALLEPFVGSTDILHHDTGLRVESAKHIRRLSVLGVKAEFSVLEDAKKIELLISFQQ